MIDIDHFKKFNDRYGHFSGDDALRSVAAVLSSSARRASDFVARTGGEEFAIILPDCSLSDAVAVATRTVESVAALSIEHLDGERDVVTVSIGVAALRIVPGVTTRPLLDLADAALYEAKHEGRNRASFRQDAMVLVS